MNILANPIFCPAWLLFFAFVCFFISLIKFILWQEQAEDMVGWMEREICFGKAPQGSAPWQKPAAEWDSGVGGGQAWVEKWKNWANSKLISHCFYIEAVEPFSSSCCPQSFPRESYIYLCFAPVSSMNMNTEQGTMVFLVYSADPIIPPKIFKL